MGKNIIKLTLKSRKINYWYNKNNFKSKLRQLNLKQMEEDHLQSNFIKRFFDHENNIKDL